MALRTSAPADRGIPRGQRRPRQEAGVPMIAPIRPRLLTITPSVAEAVEVAGGWMFDQAMAGWIVSVLTSDHCDARPLEILGVSAHDLAGLRAPVALGPCLQSVAVQADLYGSDARVRQLVTVALDGGTAEVRLWGGGSEEDPGPAGGLVRHRLSGAAQAFKAQALAASATPARPSRDVEVFRQVRAPGPGPVTG